MLNSLYVKIAGGVAALALLIAAFLWVKDAFDDRAALREWQSTTLQATQSASGNAKLVAKDVPQQIKLMGDAILNFKNQIQVQNKAVDSLEQKRKDAVAARDREVMLRKEVIQKSQSLAQELRNGAMSPVERGNLEAELRRVQDVAWEAGL